MNQKTDSPGGYFAGSLTIGAVYSILRFGLELLCGYLLSLLLERALAMETGAALRYAAAAGVLLAVGCRRSAPWPPGGAGGSFRTGSGFWRGSTPCSWRTGWTPPATALWTSSWRRT